MVDNELPAADVELTLAALSAPEGQAAWRLYHMVGDVLRNHAVEAEMSPACAARLAERLANEALPGRPPEKSPPPRGDSESPAAVVVP